MLNVITGKDQASYPMQVKGQPIVINAGETIYTDAVVSDHDNLAVSYQAQSDGIPNLSISLEQCYDTPKDNESDPISVAGQVIESSLIDKDWHNCGLKVLPLKTLRFKIVENSTTAPQVTLNLILSCK